MAHRVISLRCGISSLPGHSGPVSSADYGRNRNRRCHLVFARLGGLKSGDGPSKEEREAGFYDILFVGLTPDGKQVRVSVSGDRDPGYGSTSKMIAESAICLMRDAIDTPGGVWTPGAAMGQRLIDRLVANAGLTFQVESK